MLGQVVSFTSRNPGFGDLGFLRNIAGHLRTASMRATELGASMRSCGMQVAESWTGAAHDYWDAKLVEQASATEALAPQWAAVDTALTTYVATVEQIFKSGEEYRTTIDSYLSTASSANISVRFMTVGLGEQHQVTLTAPLMAGVTDEEFQEKLTLASDLQVLINAEVDKFWALQDDRDAANLALTSAISANLPAGWAELKGSFPAGTNPATMLPVVPAEFYGFDGIDAANKVVELVDPETGEVDPQAWVIIGEHMDDQIFCEQFMSAMGPAGAIMLGLEAHNANLGGDSSKLDDLHLLMMAGAPPASYDDAWVRAADEALQKGVVVPVQEDLATTVIADLVGDGRPAQVGGSVIYWDQASLAVLANAVMMGSPEYKPKTTIATETILYDALSNNTGAAAMAFAEYPDRHLAGGRFSSPSVEFEDAFTRFLRTATIDAGQDSNWRKLGDANVTSIISCVGANGDDQSYTERTREVFGDIAVAYWGDYEDSVTARYDLVTNPDRPGVEIDYSTWQNFLLEGMRNLDTTDKILAQFVVSDLQESDLRESAQFSNGVWSSEGKGLYFDRSRQQLMFNAQTDLLDILIQQGQIAETELAERANAVVGFVVDLIVSPRTAAGDLVKEAFHVEPDSDGLYDRGKVGDALTSAGAGALDMLENFDRSGLDAYRGLRADAECKAWENGARELLANVEDTRPGHEGEFLKLHINEVRLQTIVNDPVTGDPFPLDEEVFDGDPQKYEDAATVTAGGQKVTFRNPQDGTLRNVEEMKEFDLPAYQAFLEWMQDPAVQIALKDRDPFSGYHRPEGDVG